MLHLKVKNLAVRYLLLGTFTCILTTSNGQSILDYQFFSATSAYQPLNNTTILNQNGVWDDEKFTLPIGFPFNFAGKQYATLEVSTEGALYFDEQNIVYGLGQIDLEDKGAGTNESLSPISYELEGTVGARILKIEFKNVGFFDGDAADFINFQIWLYESLNIIEYHFGTHHITSTTAIFNGQAGLLCGLLTMEQNKLTGLLLKCHADQPTIKHLVNADLKQKNYLSNIPTEGSIYTFAPTMTEENESIFSQADIMEDKP